MTGKRKSLKKKKEVKGKRKKGKEGSKSKGREKSGEKNVHIFYVNKYI